MFELKFEGGEPPMSKWHADHTYTCMCGVHVGFGDLPKKQRTQKYIRAKVREHEANCKMLQDGLRRIQSDFSRMFGGRK